MKLHQFEVELHRANGKIACTMMALPSLMEGQYISVPVEGDEKVDATVSSVVRLGRVGIGPDLRRSPEYKVIAREVGAPAH
jgi:hypothetical protein